MDLVVEYVKNQEFRCKIIAPINQVRIYKRIILPCKLVGFQGSNKTKEAREYEEKSCVIWKLDFEIVLKLSQKSFELWNGFIDLLVE